MKLDFNKLGGLLPVVIQSVEDSRVLMVGFMNEEAYHKTLECGKVTFYSRTKQRLWTKGETSGNYLHVVKILEDCDHDTLLIKVRAVGPTCHKGRASCFGEEGTDVLPFLRYLQDYIDLRHQERPEGSYTTRLFEEGINRMAQKVGEEAVETVIEATNGTSERLIYEASDMLYHLMVLLTAKGFRIEDLVKELKKRHKI